MNLPLTVRGRAALVLTVAVTLVGASTGCSPDNLTPKTVKSEASEFCRALKGEYDMRELRSAIERNDAEAIASSLRRLDDLQTKAPTEIADDLRAVIDAVRDTVRAVTQVGSDGSDTTPVDIGTLDATLAGIAENSQHVVTYADENCGIKLSQQ